MQLKTVTKPIPEDEIDDDGNLVIPDEEIFPLEEMTKEELLSEIAARTRKISGLTLDIANKDNLIMRLRNQVKELKKQKTCLEDNNPNLEKSELKHKLEILTLKVKNFITDIGSNL